MTSSAGWEPDPALADTITADDIWNDLKTYVRERGWISLSGNETEGTEELRFHPDVVAPTRELLRCQTISRRLQESAAAHFERLSGLFVEGAKSVDANAISLACESVYHRFQAEGVEAQVYWRRTLDLVERLAGSAASIAYAAEVTGRDYARQQVEPLPFVSSPELLRSAHCEVADRILQATGLDFTSNSRPFIDFRRRVDWATIITKQFGLPPIPDYLRAIRDAAPERSRNATGLLEESIRNTSDAREKAFLTMVLATRLRRESALNAATFFEDLLRLVSTTPRTGLNPFDVAMSLAGLYEQQGNHAGVLDALRRAQAVIEADLERHAPFHYFVARYSLDTGDLSTASAHVEKLRSHPVKWQPAKMVVALARAAIGAGPR